MGEPRGLWRSSRQNKVRVLGSVIGRARLSKESRARRVDWLRSGQRGIPHHCLQPRPVIVACKVGGRSMQLAQWLEQAAGFEEVRHRIQVFAAQRRLSLLIDGSWRCRLPTAFLARSPRLSLKRNHCSFFGPRLLKLGLQCCRGDQRLLKGRPSCWGAVLMK